MDAWHDKIDNAPAKPQGFRRFVQSLRGNEDVTSALLCDVTWKILFHAVTDFQGIGFEAENGDEVEHFHDWVADGCPRSPWDAECQKELEYDGETQNHAAAA